MGGKQPLATYILLRQSSCKVIQLILPLDRSLPDNDTPAKLLYNIPYPGAPCEAPK